MRFDKSEVTIEKQCYFSALNYSLANEDTRLELALCQHYSAKHILGVCGSGGRLLPLAAAAPQTMVGLDLSAEQLHLTALRLASIRQLNIKEFCIFWGFPPYAPSVMRATRQALFSSLKMNKSAKDYCRHLLEQHAWHGLIYAGKWEKTITGIPKILRHIVGNYYDEIFSFTDIEEQRQYFQEKRNQTRWNIIPWLVLRLFGNSAYFNSMLYKGNHVRKNIEQTYFEFYSESFRRLFNNGLTKENFFLQLCFLGCLRYSEGNPVEAQPEVFTAAQAILKGDCDVNLIQDDLLSYAGKTKRKFDFLSLSDVPSYFRGETERTFLQQLARCLLPGAICVMRFFLRIPENTDISGYVDITENFAALLSAEKMQMYSIKIFQYMPQ